MPTEPGPPGPPDLPPGIAAAWGATQRPRRGPKPAHSVAQVIDAAMELADQEGIVAASLPNIAGALGLTTNALYRYVGSKDELLVLLADAGFGPPLGVQAGPDWRVSTRAWAYAALERYRARPWLLDVPFRLGDVTPNRLLWTELLLETFTAAGLSDVDALGCARLVADFIRATAERGRAVTAPDSPDSPAHAAAVHAFLGPQLASRDYPRLATLAAAGLPGPTTVDFGLDRLLDGIAHLLGPP